MKQVALTIVLVLFSYMAFAESAGVVTQPSKYSVSETIDRLENVAKSKGMNIFARIDFSALGKKIDLNVPGNQLLIFGKGRGGPKLVSAAPMAALDLPLRAVAWEDAEGKVWLSYSTAEYIKDRHDIKGRDKVITKIDSTLKAITEEALK